MASREKCEWEPCMAGSVTPSSTSPAAVASRPIHWRRPTLKPNMRSAITAMNTIPAARATWTTDIGASDSAATCRPQLPTAISMPIANHFEEYSWRAERSGCMTRTLGTSWRRGTCRRSPRFATKAHASARRMPRSRVIGEALR